MKLSTEQRIDRICDRFESAHRRGEHPRIRAFLREVDRQDQDQLFEQLLLLELDIADQQPSIDVYLSEFPERDSIIRAAFARDDTNTIGDTQAVSAGVPRAPISQIGPYGLVRQIGEGGMGTVWLAQQVTPIQRQVALKLVKTEFASEEIIERFEAERQALAIMDHPSIARIYDAGATESGSPYFVMELVEGTPITKYCDERKLTIAERLELFLPVCQAVQHAHQKGIIHRDLKPSNVLVGIYDGQAVPKVIDFGLAKALDHTTRLTDKTIQTQVGKIVGTLQYMSPEQADTDNLDIDTRTDVYSLGVILYQLLTGTTPLLRESFVGKQLLRILATIRQQEPPRPSARLTVSKNKTDAVGSARQITPARLHQILEGELDWVAMRALESDRDRRYQTASELADDIRRYLNGEPVNARPASTGYRLRKFVHKNQMLVGAVSAIALLLLAGIGGTTYGLVQAKLSATKERLAKEDAIASAKRSQDVLDVVANAFRSAGPQGGANADTTAHEILQNAVGILDGGSELDDLGQAQLLKQLGDSFQGLGDYESAIEAGERSVALRREELGPHDSSTLASMSSLGWAYRLAGRFEQAIDILEQTLEGNRQALGAENEQTLMTMNDLAMAYRMAGRAEDAARLLEEALTVKESTLGPDHWQTLYGIGNLAETYRMLDRAAEAIPLLERGVAGASKTWPPDHPDRLSMIGALAVAYAAVERNEEAIARFEEVIEAEIPKLGDSHPNVAGHKANLALVYLRVDRNEQAVELIEQALDAMKTSVGEEHPYTMMIMDGLADAYAASGRADDAAIIHLDTLAKRKATLGDDHPDTLTNMYRVGNDYKNAGNWEAAIPLLEQAYASREKLTIGDEIKEALDAAGELARQSRGSLRDPTLDR